VVLHFLLVSLLDCCAAVCMLLVASFLGVTNESQLISPSTNLSSGGYQQEALRSKSRHVEYWCDDIFAFEWRNAFQW
jgi:hypothetical protein